MGANSSSIAELSGNDYLARFSGQTPIDVQDPFWNGLLSFSFSPPASAADARLLEESVVGVCKNLTQNNLETGNFGALIRVFFRRASELKASSQSEEDGEGGGGGGGEKQAGDANISSNDIFLWQTFNALFIVRTIAKYLIEHLSEENVLRQFDAVCSGGSGADERERIAEELINCLVEIVVDVPVKQATYAIHLETLNTLVTILSVQM